MATVKFVLRYNTEQQKKKLEKIAKRCGRSANSHILQLIDSNIEMNKNVDKFNKTGVLTYEPFVDSGVIAKKIIQTSTPITAVKK